MSEQILPREYYLSSDVLHLAQDLLGKLIVTEICGQRTVAKIVETEAYKAPEDRASHAFNNKRTKRTEPIFHNGGLAYIYLCYGIHNLFNVVTGTENEPHVVLIRAVEPLEGLVHMCERRAIDQEDIKLTNGPGKWTVAMGINPTHNTCSLYKAEDPIRILSASAIPQKDIIFSERVGIAYAGECAQRPWRYRIRDSKWTSKPDRVKY
jgi:DNA-3-methyladenine glycosylase